jgi:hypothetical protein
LHNTPQWQALQRALTAEADAEKLLDEEKRAFNKSERERKNTDRAAIHRQAIAQAARDGLEYVTTSSKHKVEDGHWWCKHCQTQFFLYADAKMHDCVPKAHSVRTASTHKRKDFDASF